MVGVGSRRVEKQKEDAYGLLGAYCHDELLDIWDMIMCLLLITLLASPYCVVVNVCEQ